MYIFGQKGILSHVTADSFCMVSLQLVSLDGQLQFGQIPLVHVVMSDQLIRSGKFLLAVRPPAVEGFFT